MKKPVLLIMAAGMGSRYGGLKQIDPVDKEGHIIMDFSIYDAKRAGFEELVFIIRRENEALFREAIGDRVSRSMKVHYAYQDLADLPEGFKLPEGRKKPWGTGQAVLSAAGVTDGPFAVINADDYYGVEAFQLIYDRLVKNQEEGKTCSYTMVGYLLKNTLTDNGSVSRGICTVDEKGLLRSIVERTSIIKKEEGAAYSEDNGNSWISLDPENLVSMNMWGFPAEFMSELRERFPLFLADNLEKNPLKCEFYLPFAVNDLMKEGKAEVEVLPTHDQWHGITYHEDKEDFVKAVQKLKDEGVYPQDF